MEYPKAFPKHLQRPVDQAIADAEFEFAAAKLRGDWDSSNKAQKLFLPYVARVYFAFGGQVCQAVKDGLCTGEIARAFMATFLATIIHRAYFDNFDICGSISEGSFEANLRSWLRNSKEWRDYQRSMVAALAPQSSTPSQADNPDFPKGNGGTRTSLRDCYLQSFTAEKIKILDICWAAGQHYSEWKRWLRGAVKDGSAPDRSFREILMSGKKPTEYRKQPRPDGWK